MINDVISSEPTQIYYGNMNQLLGVLRIRRKARSIWIFACPDLLVKVNPVELK